LRRLVFSPKLTLAVARRTIHYWDFAYDLREVKSTSFESGY
jgi:hypothetical protein